MGESHNIANQVFNKVLVSGQIFTKHELAEKTIDLGGILRIDIGYTFGDYINDLKEQGLIKFLGFNEKKEPTYQAVTSFSNLINNYPQGFKANALIPLAKLSVMLKKTSIPQ